MENIPTLYSTCLRKVSLFLQEGIWNSSEDKNPFSDLPSKIADDLVSTSLRIQKIHGFRAEDLKLLLTSGILRKFKIETRISPRGGKELEKEVTQALQFLASASHNLEVLQLTYGDIEKESSELSNALHQLLQNSPNLKYVHSEIPFKLKDLRSSKQLKSILLHFIPDEPWYDFLEKENGNEKNLKILESLEIFTICGKKLIKLSEEVVSEYIMILLMHCPSLISLGTLETSKALAQLYRKDLSLQFKLRRCYWRKGRWIRDAVTCNPSVKELNLYTHCIRSIGSLRNLKNLLTLSLWITVEKDPTVQLVNVLKDIGVRLKSLNLMPLKNTVDISKLLKNCPNLELLRYYVLAQPYTELTVSLPKLKHLLLRGIEQPMKRLLRLFSGCHGLTKLELIGHGFDDETLDEFLKKNSFWNLKIAYFENSDLTKQGFKKFLLNAPNLKKVNAFNLNMHLPDESGLTEALIETNHKAISTNFCVTNSGFNFIRNVECNVRRNNVDELM